MSLSSQDNDKRAFLRIASTASIEAALLTYPLESRDQTRGVCRNISGGGVCFTSNTPFTPGSMISLNIDLGGWQNHKKSVSTLLDDSAGQVPLTVIAKVVWCHENEDRAGYDVGVTFKDVYEDDYRALLDYLDIISARATGRTVP